MSELSKTVGHPAGVPEVPGMWKSGIRGKVVFSGVLRVGETPRGMAFFLYKKGFKSFLLFPG